MSYQIEEIKNFKEIDLVNQEYTSITSNGDVGSISWLGIQWKWLKSFISFGYWGTQALDKQTLKVIHIATEIFGRDKNETVLSDDEILVSLENLKKINVREGGNYIKKIDRCLNDLQIFARKKEEPDGSTHEAIMRLQSMLKVRNGLNPKVVEEVFNQLPSSCRAILKEELSRSLDHGIFFYSSEILENCLKGKKGKAQKEALQQGLEVLARLYQEVRCFLRKKSIFSGYNLETDNVAQRIAFDSNGLKFHDIEIDFVKQSVENVQLYPPIDIGKFKNKQFQSLKDIPGKKILFVGIGGGSDGINAELVKRLTAQSGKEVVGTVSVRGEYVSYTPPKAKFKKGDQRDIVNADRKDAGIYYLHHDSDGVNFDRFFENLMVDEDHSDQSAIIIFDPYKEPEKSKDDQDDIQNKKLKADQDSIQSLTERFSNLRKFLEFDTIIAVDTGGDALYRPAVPGAVKKSYKREATPDQDLRVLLALYALLNLPCYVLELATGVDMPDYAEDVLEKADASFFEFTDEQKQFLLDSYRKLGMDETHIEEQSKTGIFGKTPSALQQAFDPTKKGYTFIPLPEDRITDLESPLNPCVKITHAMSGAFLMDLKNLMNNYEIKA